MFKVYAVNRAGSGVPVNTTHCLQVPTPTVSCDATAIDQLNVSVKLPSYSSYLSNGYNLTLLVFYQDVDLHPQDKRIPVNDRQQITVPGECNSLHHI